MTRIQIDMFEVQLGAALLLQFHRARGRPVRVLADAGVKASGYPADHVHRKLQEAFESFGDAHRGIDLIIGTHYDEDHLRGLVPIIADETIDIGEAWLPPVANDTEPHARGETVADHHLLATQLAGDDGPERLADYLRAKAGVCQQLADLEHTADQFRPTRPRRRATASGPATQTPTDARDVAAWARLFAAHEEDAEATLASRGTDLTHAGDPVISGNLLLEPEPPGSRGPAEAEPGITADDLLTRWRASRDFAETDAADLAAIRRAAARDAINAIALAAVASALAARGIPIRCPIIDEGVPQQFTWSAAQRRFLPGASRGARGPQLVLLGPSEALVRKHWHRLPVGGYLTRAAGMQIPILGITPSNQLSYVLRFGFAGQGILVSGDAGFVDFQSPGGDYYPALLEALLPLHVVQVAHHAGNNAHFYRALLAAGYDDQDDNSLLLVSHAVRDRFRPSKEFDLFVQQALSGHGHPRILFTSKPTAAKVRTYRSAIHPVIGDPHLVGDVRIGFDHDQWGVVHHSIRA